MKGRDHSAGGLAEDSPMCVDRYEEKIRRQERGLHGGGGGGRGEGENRGESWGCGGAEQSQVLRVMLSQSSLLEQMAVFLGSGVGAGEGV